MTYEQYNQALETFRAAAKAHQKVIEAYRARTIDDAAFLVSRAAFQAAQLACDEAEAAYVRANSLEMPNNRHTDCDCSACLPWTF